MSKEFEEIVLKKLDLLNERMSSTDKVMQETVLKKLDMLDERTSNTDKIMQETVLKKLDMLEERTSNTDKVVQEMQLELKDTQEVVKYLNQSFTKFDYEINRKIDTLFDAYTTNKENNSVNEKNIISLEAKVFNHDIRISNLEDKVLPA